MASTTTTATTSRPISVWLLLLTLLAVGRIEQAAATYECECNLNIVDGGYEQFANRTADLKLPRGIGDKAEWLEAVENATDVNGRKWTDYDNWNESIKALWPRCDNGKCEADRWSAAWSRMQTIQFTHWQTIVGVNQTQINADWKPRCVKAHMRLFHNATSTRQLQPTVLYTGCAIRSPTPYLHGLGNWEDEETTEGKSCKEAGGIDGHKGFCVLEEVPPLPREEPAPLPKESPTTSGQSTTTAASTTTATVPQRTSDGSTASQTGPTPTPATVPTTTPQPTASKSGPTSPPATTAGTSKRAMESNVAMVAAILLSLAATRLLPTTITAIGG